MVERKEASRRMIRRVQMMFQVIKDLIRAVLEVQIISREREK